jgi:sugar/nucleoside kinase (ribokinase family)
MTTPLWDVIGLGENSVDYVYRVPQLPTPGGKLPIHGRRVSVGGQVATTLCACAAWGLRTKYLGAFGNDANSERIRTALAERGIDISDAPVRNAANRYAVILVDTGTGERSVLWERDAALVFQPRDLAPELVTRTRLLHVDAVHEEAAIAAAQMARKARTLVTIDLDRAIPRAGELIRAVDAAILANGVPQTMTGEQDPARALRELRKKHDNWLCVTLGSEGAMLLVGDRLHYAPSPHVEAVDTTGAGDVFRAGFIYALLRGDAPHDILRFANAAAALSCTRQGAIDSVPAVDDVGRLLGR